MALCSVTARAARKVITITFRTPGIGFWGYLGAIFGNFEAIFGIFEVIFGLFGVILKAEALVMLASGGA